MGDELQVPSATLSEIQGQLDKGRSALEGTGSSAPGGIDAGDMTAMLTGMMSKVIDQAATLSEGLAAISGQVAEAGSHFWEVDAAVGASYGGAGGPRAD